MNFLKHGDISMRKPPPGTLSSGVFRKLSSQACEAEDGIAECADLVEGSGVGGELASLKTGDAPTCLLLL